MKSSTAIRCDIIEIVCSSFPRSDKKMQQLKYDKITGTLHFNQSKAMKKCQ